MPAGQTPAGWLQQCAVSAGAGLSAAAARECCAARGHALPCPPLRQVQGRGGHAPRTALRSQAPCRTPLTRGGESTPCRRQRWCTRRLPGRKPRRSTGRQAGRRPSSCAVQRGQVRAGSERLLAGRRRGQGRQRRQGILPLLLLLECAHAVACCLPCWHRPAKAKDPGIPGRHAAAARTSRQSHTPYSSPPPAGQPHRRLGQKWRR